MKTHRTYYTVDNIPVTNIIVIADNAKPFPTKAMAKKYCVKNEMQNMTIGIYKNGYCLVERIK